MDFFFTLLCFTKTDTYEHLQAMNNFTFVKVDINLKNVGENKGAFKGNPGKLIGSDEHYSYVLEGSKYKLQPGEFYKDFRITYLIPEGANLESVTLSDDNENIICTILLTN